MTNRPLALITGASSGIGAALALTYAARGYDLVLVARRRDRLQEVAAQAAGSGAGTEILVADLATPDGLADVAGRAARGDVRLLVSCAGVSGYKPLHDLSAADIDQLWRLNATAPVTLAHAVLPSLRERGEGAVVTIASLLAFSTGQRTLDTDAVSMTLPPRTMYAAAKSATVAFTRALAAELAGTGVTATVVCPGRVATEWSGNQSQENQPGVMSAQDVATATAAAVELGETVCVPGLADTGSVDRFTDAERELLSDGNRADIADRYRAPGR
ncbi:SDR family NAD(P)-dependent oxidoreductase [Streptomyces sp. NPDC048106]|uniref:SDR family NAD(P)-dependent oxidoreductase n=1 Tax=Streptomyces sp. NPDC048106 TaxID=3155750 RepID=UPI0034547C33